MFVELRYLYVYRNTLVEFAAYFSTGSVRDLSYTLLAAIKKIEAIDMTLVSYLFFLL